jgi:periplasmic divalent cation tolerance protein
VLVTAGSGDEAATIARALVDERLAACANIVSGITSIYRWQGRVEQASETLLIIKTDRRQLDALVGRVRALHSYTVPEVVALAIDGGSAPYLRWLDEEVAR